jgi:hypothetical protein
MGIPVVYTYLMSRNESQIPPRDTKGPTMSDAPTTVTVKALAIRIAEAKELDPADAAKALRRRIRRDFDDLATDWPGLDEAKENRDGNRYPPMPADLADALFANMCPTATSDDADEAPRDVSGDRG